MMESILFTRTEEQNIADIAFLKKQIQESITCVGVSLIEAKPLENVMWDDFAKYEWICFTSSFTVKYFWESLTTQQRHDIRKMKCMAIGSVTAETLYEYSGIQAFVPTIFTANALVEEWLAFQGENMASILLPKSDLATSEIEQKLRSAGHRIESVVLYENKMPLENQEALRRAIMNGLDRVIITSPSIWHRFWEVFSTIKNPQVPTIYAIGPITQKAIQAVGMDAKTPYVGHTTMKDILTIIASEIDTKKTYQG